MRSAHIAGSLTTMLLAATLAYAQPQPQTQPPQPQPQDPTPIPEAKPPVTKPEPEPRRPAGSGRIGGRGEIVVTGCLQRGEDARTASRSSESKDPESKDQDSKEQKALSGTYLLKEATTAKPASDSPSASGQPSSQGGSKEYRLVAGDDSISLAEHVGKQVEVKGRVTLEDRSPDGKSADSSVSSSQPSGSTGVATVPPETGAPPAQPPLVTLKASSVKTIGASCGAPAS